jgi:putative transposase
LLRLLGLLSMEETPRHRRSIRLKGYDYSQAGAYFVTICTHDRAKILGSIVDGEMRLNSAGAAAHAAWLNLPRRFPSVRLREFVVMPNHLHGIVILTKPYRVAAGGAASSAPTTDPGVDHPSLGKIIRAFKSRSAIEINRLWGRRNQAVWQRNYYEHIIRPGKAFDQIRIYILENAAAWDQDPENV